MNLEHIIDAVSSRQYDRNSPPEPKTCDCKLFSIPWFYIENLGWKSQSKCEQCQKKDAFYLVAKDKDEVIIQLLKESGLKGKLLRMTLNNLYCHDHKLIFDTVIKYCSNFTNATKRGLFIHGNPGLGKTHLAAGLTRDIIEKHETKVLFYSSVDLLLQIRWAMNESMVSETNLITKLANCPLLVIDDLGTEKVTDWVQQIIYKIIDDRNLLEKPTVITSNYSLEGLAPKIGEKITSRMIEMCQLIHMQGEDFRVKSKLKNNKSKE